MPPSGEITGQAILVGVYPGESSRVIQEGLKAARESGDALVFAHVRATSYLAEWDTPRDRRENPPVETRGDDLLTAELTSTISAIAGLDTDWTLRLIDGDPPKALARLAEEINASRIIVGSRLPGFVNAVDEWLSRSVAMRLIHLQRRPVVVVPLLDKLTDETESGRHGSNQL